MLKSLEEDTARYNNGKIAPQDMYLGPNIQKKLSTTFIVGLLQAYITSILKLTRSNIYGM